MVQFEILLNAYDSQEGYYGVLKDSCTGKDIAIQSIDKNVLQDASIRLAHEGRHYTINTWLDSLERNNYNPR